MQPAAVEKIDRATYQKPSWQAANADRFSTTGYEPILGRCTVQWFAPDDFMKYGKLVEVSVDALQLRLWVVKIREGMQAYHSSRSVVANDSTFPIPKYSIASTEDQNRSVDSANALRLGIDPGSTNVPCWTDEDKFSSCTSNAYFAGAPQGEYINYTAGSPFEEPVFYAYGYNTKSAGTYANKEKTFNDRTSIKANEYPWRGLVAYETRKPLTYLMAMPDPFFERAKFMIYYDNLKFVFAATGYDPTSATHNHAIGSATGYSLKDNMTYLNYLGYYSPKVLAERMKRENKTKDQILREAKNAAVDFYASRLLPVLNFVTKARYDKTQAGQDTVGECLGAVRYIIKALGTYLQANVISGVPITLQQLSGFLSQLYDSPQGTIPGFYDQDIKFSVNVGGQILSVIPGIRTSTFESDRPAHSLYRRALRTYNGQFKIVSTNSVINVDGTLGGYTYNPRWKPELGIATTNILGTVYDIIAPSQNSSANLFHCEMILPYAPDTLRVSTKNDLSTYYALNTLGVMDNMRKYKTTNILRKICDPADSTKCVANNFHQGHLYEHSSWVAINAASYRDNTQVISWTPNAKVFAVAGVLHDIGKAGDCVNKVEEWTNYDPHSIPKMNGCDIVTSQKGNQVGFSYFDIPIHPERGYRMLYGLKPFIAYDYEKPQGTARSNFLDLKQSNAFTYPDWEYYAKENGITADEMKYVRISTGAHWHLSPIIGKWVELIASPRLQGESQQNYDARIAAGKLSLVRQYVKVIELFYNSEFPKYDRRTFLEALAVAAVVSYADLQGSMYDPTKPDYEDYSLRNELPNYTPFGEKEIYRKYLLSNADFRNKAIEDMTVDVTRRIQEKVKAQVPNPVANAGIPKALENKIGEYYNSYGRYNAALFKASIKDVILVDKAVQDYAATIALNAQYPINNYDENFFSEYMREKYVSGLDPSVQATRSAILRKAAANINQEVQRQLATIHVPDFPAPMKEYLDRVYQNNFNENHILNALTATTWDDGVAKLVIEAVGGIEYLMKLYLKEAAETNASGSRPEEFARNIRNNLDVFVTQCIAFVRGSYVNNPRNSFVTMDNLLYGFNSVEGLYQAYGHTNNLPRVLMFDLDATLFNMFGNANGPDFFADLATAKNKYMYFPDVQKIMDEANNLREKFGVLVAVATRHYAPGVLREAINIPGSPLYNKVDIFISQYTGDSRFLVDTWCPGITNRRQPSESNCKLSTLENEGFGFTVLKPYGGNVIRGQGTYNAQNPAYAQQVPTDDDSGTKVVHMREILRISRDMDQRMAQAGKELWRRKKYILRDIQYKDMILFDDSAKYILPEKTLQYLGTQDIFTAGVARNGLTLDLFEKALALFAFQRLSQ